MSGKQELDGVKAYTSGVRGKPVIQTHFLDLVEIPSSWIEGIPDTTPPEIYSNFEGVIQIVRSIYVPNYSDTEAELLAEGCRWVDQNRLNFFKNWVDDYNPSPDWPVSVLLNKKSLSLPFMLQRPKRLRHLPLSEKITFAPGSKALKDDIRVSTFDMAGRIFRRNVLEGREYLPYVDSATRTIELVSKMYFSGGEMDPVDRGEAIDLVSWQLGMKYYSVLIKRLETVKDYGTWYTTRFF